MTFRNPNIEQSDIMTAWLKCPCACDAKSSYSGAALSFSQTKFSLFAVAPKESEGVVFIVTSTSLGIATFCHVDAVTVVSATC